MDRKKLMVTIIIIFLCKRDKLSVELIISGVSSQALSMIIYESEGSAVQNKIKYDELIKGYKPLVQ